MKLKRRVDESQHLGGSDRGVPVDEPKIRLSRREGATPGPKSDHAQDRALGRELAIRHLGEDSARAWQGFADPAEAREPSDLEHLGRENARAGGARLE